MGKVVLVTMGSWGDIFPVIGLARGLAGLGHEPRIAASAAYEELVRGAGLGFTAVGPALDLADYARDPRILSGRMGGFAGFAHLFRRFIFPVLDRYVADIAAAISATDLLLAHPAMVAAPIAAERAGVPWATISVFPGLIPTASALPAPTRVPIPPRWTAAASRAAWSVARHNMARLFDEPVNAARRRVGLDPVSDAFLIPVSSGRPYLVMASPAVIERPADWPGSVALTGFVTWDRAGSVPASDALTSFLDGGEAPVLVTLGASSSLDPQRFYEHAADAVTGGGRRALVLTGPTPVPVSLPGDPRVFVTPFAPLSEVAPRCAAAIHHGGVGTTVGILRSGLPQLVVPRAFDQPQTALRMARLGVARTLRWRRASPGRLATELAALLGDDGYARAARALRARLAGEDGLSATVRAVGETLAG